MSLPCKNHGVLERAVMRGRWNGVFAYQQPSGDGRTNLAWPTDRHAERVEWPSGAMKNGKYD